MSTNKIKPRSRSILGWPTAIILLVLSKLKWFLALFKLGKLATLASMLVSLWGYALFYGWKFAIAIIYLLFIHELGHLVAAKVKKIPTSPAIFIPFMGAAIGIDPKKIPNARTEFFIAYGGPLAGLISIIPAVLLYFITGNPYWALIIHLGAFLNLFNLFPISPLDGGRIVSVLSTKIWLLGLIILIPIMFISPDPILFLLFIFGIFSWLNQRKEAIKVDILKSQHTLLTKVNEELILVTKHTSETSFNYDGLKRLLNQLIDQKYKINQLMINRTKKSRKVKKQLIAEEKLLTNRILELTSALSENSSFNLRNILDRNNKDLQEVNKEIDQIRSYYQSSTRTKLAALFLYLGLAVGLALLLVYGNNILEGRLQ
ncbi:site-2 protease family protein [Aquibacillus kalidii]|uniref:site-2 protease family protein n=1 Tax=Aquibacillus kalidii TaxID=2762597 RepID=UPI001647FDC9|nr:site-2 protease family protein [Aquibacillus kalidii]